MADEILANYGVHSSSSNSNSNSGQRGEVQEQELQQEEQDPECPPISSSAAALAADNSNRSRYNNKNETKSDTPYAAADGGGGSASTASSTSTSGEDVVALEEGLENEKNQDNHNKNKNNHNKNKNMMRSIIFIVLFLAAMIVTAAIYTWIRKDQVQTLELEFQAHSSLLLHAISKSLVQQIQAIDAMSVTFASFAMATSQTFPNVTLANFEMRGSSTRILSDSSMIHFHPLVTDETREGWEAYELEHRNEYFDTSYNSDVQQRQYQNERYGILDNNNRRGRKIMEGEVQEEAEELVVSNSTNVTAPLEPMDYIFDLAPDGKSYIRSPKGSGPYLPIWQISPVVPNKEVLNFNVLSHPTAGGAFRQVLNTGEAVLDIASNLNSNNNDKNKNNNDEIHHPTEDSSLGFLPNLQSIILSHGQYRERVEEELLKEPFTTMVYPVFDSFGDFSSSSTSTSSTSTSSSSSSRNIVGVISASLFWRHYLQNVLPSNVNGIVCVIENNHGQTFTFQVNGREATYLGLGDLHSDKYNDFEEATSMLLLLNGKDDSTTTAAAAAMMIETRSYSSVELNHDYTTYKIRVYPTQEYKEDYVDNTPLILSATILSVFLFTTGAFMLYEMFFIATTTTTTTTTTTLGGNHQSNVATSASKTTTTTTTANTSTNPPQSPKKQKQESILKTSSRSSRRSMSISSSSSSSLSNSKKKMWNNNNNNNEENEEKSEIFSNRFDEATVFVAEIDGFSEWCSLRDTDQVFEFLDIIFHEFDKIAALPKYKQNNLLRIETMGGDCYVAATGVLPPLLPPEQIANHAVVMAEFSLDCMNRINELLLFSMPTTTTNDDSDDSNTTTDNLISKFGPGIEDLSIRIGLHSGSVIAGVLRRRQQKKKKQQSSSPSSSSSSFSSRFQLFGDTVNIASHMERTSFKGRIHCSQSTADALIQSGKQGWILPRQDKVPPMWKANSSSSTTTTSTTTGEMQTYWLVDAST